MQVETSTNIKQSWSIRLHYQTTIISVSFSIFRTPYSSLALLSYSKSEQSCLSSIPIPFFFFFFHNPRTFFVTGFSNKRTCQIFLQAFQMKHHLRFSGITITNKREHWHIYVFLYMRVCVYIYLKKPTVQLSTETKIGVFLVQHKTQHFQAFGTHISEHGRLFSG